MILATVFGTWGMSNLFIPKKSAVQSDSAGHSLSSEPLGEG